MTLNIKTSTFSIEYKGAEFIFKYGTHKDLVEIIDVREKGEVHLIKHFASRLMEVKNLNIDGEPATVDQVLELPPEIISAITGKWVDATIAKISGTDKSKAKKEGNEKIKGRLEWLLLIDDRYECSKCSSRYLKSPKNKPPCLTDKGCPVNVHPQHGLGKGVAEDPEINSVCQAFIKAKRFDLLEGYTHMRNEILERNGLTDPDLIFDLEQIWLEYKQYRQKLAEQHRRNG